MIPPNEYDTDNKRFRSIAQKMGSWAPIKMLAKKLNDPKTDFQSCHTKIAIAQSFFANCPQILHK